MKQKVAILVQMRNILCPLNLAKNELRHKKKLIQERLSDPQKVLSLFGDKFVLMWADYDSAPLWSLVTLEKTDKDMVSLKRGSYKI